MALAACFTVAVFSGRRNELYFFMQYDIRAVLKIYWQSKAVAQEPSTTTDFYVMITDL